MTWIVTGCVWVLACTVIATLPIGRQIVPGVMLMMAFVIARWTQYCVYRCGGDRSSFPVNISCFFLFIMLYASLAVGSADVMALITWQAGIAFTYCAIRAIKKILQLQPELGWIEEA